MPELNSFYTILLCAATVASLGCVGVDSNDEVGLCYRTSGDVTQTSCSIGNNDGTCGTAGADYSWYGDYDSFTACSDAAEREWSSTPAAPQAPNTSDVCQYTNDGECDEGTYCAYGTDTADCQGPPPDTDTERPPASDEPEPENSCWSGAHNDGTPCVVASAETVDSFGTPQIRLYLKNTCSGRVYGKFCNERTDGTWDCGADGIRGGETKTWSTLEPSGNYWGVFTGSDDWSEDWVCASEAGITNAEP